MNRRDLLAQAGLRLFTLATALVAVGNAIAEPVRVTIWVPLPPGSYSHIRWGKQRPGILSVSSPAAMPAILIFTPPSNPAGNPSPADYYAELAAFLQEVPVDSFTEIWQSGGDGSNLVAMRFPSGCVGAISADREHKVHVAKVPSVFTDSAMIELLARRFAAHGPVRLLLLSSSFVVANTDPEGPRYSYVDEFMDIIGASGLAVFPVNIPPARQESAKSKRSDSTDIFGTRVVTAGGRPGDGLLMAHKMAVHGSLLTFEVIPGSRPNRPEVLRVYGPNQKKPLFQRPLAVGGVTSGAEKDRDKMSQYFCRIARPVPIQQVEIVSQCDSRTVLSQTKRFVRLKGAFPSGVPRDSDVSVAVDPIEPAVQPRLVDRSRPPARLSVNGDSACVGPLEVPPQSTIGFYNQAHNFMFVIKVGKY